MNCIITQAKDQGKRLKDWILYHYEEGFDTFIFFDDYSEDDTIEILKKISDKYNINIIINNSDGFGNKKSLYEMTNSNNYGGDISINYRIIRSYNLGLQIARDLDKNSICAILDVDEFLVSNEGKVINVVKNLLDNKFKHIYVNSFDVYDGFIVDDWYTTQECTKYRWDFISRNNSIFKNRGKSICLSSSIIEIPQGPNCVHTLKENINEEYFKNIDIEDFNKLRIHHFRNPMLDKTILLEEDVTLINKMRIIKEKYEI